MIHCIDCGTRLGGRYTATRCRPCNNVHKAPKMYGFQHKQETLAHMVQVARVQRAKAKGREPITPERIQAMRERRAQGATLKTLAEEFSICEAMAGVYLRFDTFADYRRHLNAG